MASHNAPLVWIDCEVTSLYMNPTEREQTLNK